jgi:hypothetical protein
MNNISQLRDRHRLVSIIVESQSGRGREVAKLLLERNSRLPIIRPSIFSSNEAWLLPLWNAMPYLTRFIDPYRRRVVSTMTKEYVRIVRAHVYAALELIDSLTFTGVTGPEKVWNKILPSTDSELRNATEPIIASLMDSMDPNNNMDSVELSLALNNYDGPFPNALKVVYTQEYQSIDDTYYEYVADDGIVDGEMVPKYKNTTNISDIVEILDVATNKSLPVGELLDDWNEYYDDIIDDGYVDFTKLWPRMLYVEYVNIDFDEDWDPDHGHSVDGRVQIHIDTIPKLIDDGLVRRVMPWFSERVGFYYEVFNY